MFKVCMKKYFVSLRHIFGVLGVLFLALLIGGSILFSGGGEALSTMTEDIKTVTGQSDLSVTRVFDAIKNDFSDMVSEGEVDEDGNRIMSVDEAENAVNQSVEDALSETVENYGDYMADVGNAVAEAVGKILILILVYIVIQVISWMVGKWYVLVAEKSYFSKKGQHTIRGLLLHDGLVLLTFVLLFLGIYLNSDLIPLWLGLYPLVYCIASLISSDLSFGKGRIPVGKALRIQNILCLLGANLAQLVITAVLVVILATLVNWIIALYLGIALIVISSATVTINSDAIILHMIYREKALAEKRLQQMAQAN